MRTLTEVLPATKSNRNTAIRWTPSETVLGGGMLTIESKRSSATYAVVPYATPWEGSAFSFVKYDAGTDAEEDGYDVFVCYRDRDRGSHCTCKGFQRWGRQGPCKHLAAALAIIDNGWLAGDRVNPEADTANMEAPF